jgi:hypothetical protein
MHSTRARDNAIPTVFKLVGEWEVLPRGYFQSPPLAGKHHASRKFLRFVRSHDGPKSSSPSAAND